MMTNLKRRMQHKRLQGLLVLIPSRIRSMGNFVSSPSEVSGRELLRSELTYLLTYLQSCDRKRIWLLYCCEYYTGDNYVDDSEMYVLH